MSIKTLINPKTSQEAQANLEAVALQLEESNTKLSKLKEEKESLLLTAADDVLDTQARKIQEEQRQADRLNAAHTLLASRREELLADEAKVSAKDGIAKARKAMARGIKMLDEYQAAAQKIAGLIKETANCHSIIDAAFEAAKEQELDTASYEDIRYPHEALSVPDKSICERTVRNDVDMSRCPPGVAPEDWDARYIENTKTIPGKEVLNLARPGSSRLIRLPDAFGGGMLVKQ